MVSYSTHAPTIHGTTCNVYLDMCKLILWRTFELFYSVQLEVLPFLRLKLCQKVLAGQFICSALLCLALLERGLRWHVLCRLILGGRVYPQPPLLLEA